MATADYYTNDAHTRRRAGMWSGMLLTALVTAALVAFILQNTEDVRVHFLNMHFNLPISICMLLSAIAGALVAALIEGIRVLRRRH